VGSSLDMDKIINNERITSDKQIKDYELSTDWTLNEDISRIKEIITYKNGGQ
jgi:hypothetical protein